MWFFPPFSRITSFERRCFVDKCSSFKFKYTFLTNLLLHAPKHMGNYGRIPTHSKREFGIKFYYYLLFILGFETYENLGRDPECSKI